ncbi:MAG: hypothetical protein B1H11_06480 [Desulfobacteraceae bacterium 4484_190.1]|nr:MAG: hypothetical protein B1H11_06480 [Desulfobacteraceae bacterium 4484_190.1]
MIALINGLILIINAGYFINNILNLQDSRLMRSQKYCRNKPGKDGLKLCVCLGKLFCLRL